MGGFPETEVREARCLSARMTGCTEGATAPPSVTSDGETAQGGIHGGTLQACVSPVLTQQYTVVTAEALSLAALIISVFRLIPLTSLFSSTCESH